jgi:hypothetical protein
MNNSKFWGEGSKVSAQNNFTVGSNLPKKLNLGKENKVAKGLGITGAIIGVLLVAVLAISYITLIRPAVALVSVANVLMADKDAIAKSLTDRDLISLDKVLTKTAEDLNKVKAQRESSFGWMKSVKLLKLNEFYSDSDRFINSAFYAIDAVKEMEKIVTPFADAAGLKIREDQQVVQAEGLMEAFQTWVSIMPEVANQMDGVITIVAKIGDELAPIDTTKYPKSFRGMEIRSSIEFIKNNLSRQMTTHRT